ncbi:MAG: CARDB domain-containing protein [Methanosarcinales archaeon]
MSPLFIGNYAINVCADGDYKIDEKDETNNCKQYGEGGSIL